MRPTYESEVDRANQKAFKETIETKRNVKLYDFGTFSAIDYICVKAKDNQAVALAELKCRAIKSTDYPTLFISLAKFEKAALMTTHLSIPFILFIRCLEKDIYYKHDKANQIQLTIEDSANSGRSKNKRDLMDIEAVIHIPISLFKDVI